MSPAVTIQTMDKAIVINLGVIATALEAMDWFANIFLRFFFNLLCGRDNTVIVEVGAAVQARIGAVNQQLGRPAAATRTLGTDGDVIRAWSAIVVIVVIIGIGYFVILLKIFGQFTCVLVIIIVLPHFFIVRHRVAIIISP